MAEKTDPKTRNKITAIGKELRREKKGVFVFAPQELGFDTPANFEVIVTPTNWSQTHHVLKDYGKHGGVEYEARLYKDGEYTGIFTNGATPVRKFSKMKNADDWEKVIREELVGSRRGILAFFRGDEEGTQLPGVTEHAEREIQSVEDEINEAKVNIIEEMDGKPVQIIDSNGEVIIEEATADQALDKLQKTQQPNNYALVTVSDNNDKTNPAVIIGSMIALDEKLQLIPIGERKEITMDIESMANLTGAKLKEAYKRVATRLTTALRTKYMYPSRRIYTKEELLRFREKARKGI